MAENKAFQEWEDAVRDFLLIVDKHIIKLIPALLLTHRIQGDPVWSFLVAPPSGAKTEFIKAMNSIAGVYPISTLTSKTLVSGARMAGGDTSLLLRVQDGYFTFEDFTTIMSEHKDEAGAIMGQLRAIYGGKYDKDFGTGDSVRWEGKITLIAGATYAIHSKRQVFSNMGERFMIYNIQQPDRFEVTYRTLENNEEFDVKEKREAMEKALHHLVDEVTKIPEKMAKMSKKDKKLIVDIAEFTTRVRSSVERDYSSPKKEIIEVYPPEMPSRLAAQIHKIAQAFMILNFNSTGKYELLEEDTECLKRLAVDCISPARRLILVELAKYNEIEGPALAVKLNLPSTTIDRYLQDFDALKVLNRTKSGRSNQWSMKPNYRKLVASIEHIEVTEEELTESIAYEEAGLELPLDANWDDIPDGSMPDSSSDGTPPGDER